MRKLRVSIALNLSGSTHGFKPDVSLPVAEVTFDNGWEMGQCRLWVWTANVSKEWDTYVHRSAPLLGDVTHESDFLTAVSRGGWAVRTGL